MTAVTFPNGNGYSDDGTTAHDMRNGGHRTNLLPMIADTITVASNAVTAASQAVPAAASATTDAATATAQAAIAVAAANTAAGIVQVKQPSEIAGIDPVLDFPFRSATAVPAGVITGSSGKWVFNQAGVLVNVPSGTAPVDFDPTTSALRGLRVEEARTNLILGSDAPSTQAVAVTAQAYTLSFYGTGTVTLSGTYSGSAVGTGAFPNQKTLTFTPTAGSLTLTISGTVQYAQLEAGSFATSYIKTVGSTVTRSADVNTLLLSSVPGWNASEGTIYVSGIAPPAIASGVTQVLWQIDDGTSASRLFVRREEGTGAMTAYSIVSGALAAILPLGAVANGAAFKVAFAWKAGSFAASLNGAAAVTATSGAIPAGLTTLRVGHDAAGNRLNSTISRLTGFSRRLADATHPLLTA